MVKKETDAKGCLSLLGFPGYLYAIYTCLWGHINPWVLLVVILISVLLIITYLLDYDDYVNKMYKKPSEGFLSNVFDYIGDTPSLIILLFFILTYVFVGFQSRIFTNIVGIYLILIPFVQKITSLIEENNNLKSSNESLKRELNSIKSDYGWMIKDTLSGAMTLTESKKVSLEKTLESLEK